MKSFHFLGKHSSRNTPNKGKHNKSQKRHHNAHKKKDAEEKPAFVAPYDVDVSFLDTVKSGINALELAVSI